MKTSRFEQIRPGKNPLLLLAAIFMLLVVAVSARAQVTNATGTIQGTVTDSAGAAVPGAKVTLTEPANGSTKVINTTGSGYYSAGSLVPGNYTIKVEAPGFETTSENFEVRVGVTTNGDVKMPVGATTQQVEVQASAIGIDTQQTQIAGVLTQEQIANLPVNGRNFLDLAQLQPGVQIQDGTNFDPTKNGFESISFGGRFGRTARIELDGLDISDENVGTTTQNISQTAIQEFQVAQSNLDITTSITSSGSVNIVSRSGSNQIHGEGDYFFRDKAAGGANFPGGQNNYLQRNDIAGGAGGPIVPDKAFYFISAENYTQHFEAPVSLAGTPFADLSGSYPATYKELHLLGRVDFNLIHGAHGFIRSAYFNNKDTGGFGGGNNYSPYLNVNNVPNVGGGLDFLTGNFSQSIRVGYFKFYNEITDASSVTQNPAYNSTPGVNLVIGAFQSGTNLLAPQQTVQSNKQFKYDGSWTKGNHTVRYGVGIDHILGGGFASFYGLEPEVDLSYSSAVSNQFPGGAANPQNYIVGSNAPLNVGVILGNGQGYNTEIPQFGYPGGGQQDWRTTAYLGDQWKVSPRLTVNYGLRYIRDTGRTDSDLPPIPLLDQVGPGLGGRVHQPNSNFGPQAGIAWDINGKGKTVIRAGAGIYYENNVWNNVLFDRPARLQQGLFFADSVICPATSIALPVGNPLTTIDGTPNGIPIKSICGSPIGAVNGEIQQLQQTYQARIKAIGPSQNGNYVGTALFASSALNGEALFLPQYKTPESFQMNIGIQREIAKNLVVTADYVRNVGQNFLLGIDENHVGAARNFNAAAARAAVATTLTACGVNTVDQAIAACPGIYPTGGGATIHDFAANGLDSLNTGGGPPNPAFAFGGNNPNFGQFEFLAPVARSVYNALQITVTQRAVHPVRFIDAMNLTGAYTYSHFDGTGGSSDINAGAGGDQDFASTALNYDRPSLYYGPNSLDRHQQFSASLGLEMFKGFRLDTIAHLYSSLPTSLNVQPTGSGDIFISDFDGDGTVGDIVPGSNVGSFMRQYGPHNINNLINSYNAKYTNQLTPAGAQVVNAGVLTAAQMVALGGVTGALTPAPPNQVGNDILRIWDVGAAYDWKIGEGLTVQPGVRAFNILNMANFDAPGTLGSTRISGVLNGAPGSANNTIGTLGAANGQGAYRIGTGTGVYAFGAPRQLEFSLKLIF
jgi:Carboxypeptidase regulatory-like domain